MKSEPSARRIARLGLLTAAALILSLLDGMIPLPLPWLKLGLANAVTLLLLLSRRRTDAVLCLTARLLLGALFSGNPSALLYSAAGAAFSFAVMAFLCRFYPNRLSPVGVSAAGAAAHQLGQLAAAALTLGSPSVLALAPPLLLAGLLSGMLIGALTAVLFPRFSPYL